MILLPYRLIVTVLSFLYLILPIPLSASIRDVLGLPEIDTFIYFISVIYCLMVFGILFGVSKNVIISESKSTFVRKLSFFLVMIAIVLVNLLFIKQIFNQDTYFYFDKTLAHVKYNEISNQFSLRNIYNVGLILLIFNISMCNFKGYQFLFFIFPVLFEMIFSQHNYLTHLLVFLFLWAWNSNLNKKYALFLSVFIVTLLLSVRLYLYSSIQEDFLKTFSAFLGEFTISWQSIPSALSFHGSNYIFSADEIWYSDALTHSINLNIGLAGNPVSEVIFYSGNFAFLSLIFLSIWMIVLSKLAIRSSFIAMAHFVLIFYLRDVMRTGFFLGFSILIKSILIFLIAMTLIFYVSKLKFNNTFEELKI